MDALSPIPPEVANPAALVCDADALIQFFVAKQFVPLQVLRNRYGVQPIIVPEVELELRWTRRYKSTFVPDLTKALATGLLKVCDVSLIATLGVPATLAATAVQQVQDLGARFALHGGDGESYTHATALTLGLPALSHDRAALDVFTEKGLPVPKTVLRVYDLIVICHRTGVLTTAQCEAFRKALDAANERIFPSVFRRMSYANAVAQFSPRLFDSACAPSPLPVPETPFAHTIVLKAF